MAWFSKPVEFDPVQAAQDVKDNAYLQDRLYPHIRLQREALEVRAGIRERLGLLKTATLTP